MEISIHNRSLEFALGYSCPVGSFALTEEKNTTPDKIEQIDPLHPVPQQEQPTGSPSGHLSDRGAEG